MSHMFVTKRDGTTEPVSFDEITNRIESLCKDLKNVNVTLVTQKVIAGMKNGVKTSELDDLSAETSAYLTVQHHEYSMLAARIVVSNLHKMTSGSVKSVLPYLNDNTNKFVEKHMEVMDTTLNHENDFGYDYFGVKTLTKAYLYRDPKTKEIIERVQVMLMRVAAGIHADSDDIDACLETYKYMSEKYFTHATPTMFNAGTSHPQLASCFLMPVCEDSIEGIFDTLKRCALISKSAGGIGLSVTNVRAKGSHIASTNGTSNGLAPMARVLDAVARYVDQGGGRRKGSIALYIETWHADIMDFLDLKKNHGKEELRARDLFYALWVSDLFMKRVEEDGVWSLFCPNDTPELVDSWGETFETKYKEYEREGKAREVIKAQKLWFAILDSQIETGTPYMLFKDACNRKSNHNHLGTIRCSNLCTEIVEYSSADEVAVCNLASIALPKFVNTITGGKCFSKEGTKTFNFDLLRTIVHVVTNNLNRVIDTSYYPIPEARASNLAHRPIGIGVQGLADVFMMMGFAFDSEEAKELNKLIFETIYFAALEKSCELAQKFGPYDSWMGSEVQRGKLQFDMWGVVPSSTLEWGALREKIKQHGLRNSLLVAPMPTASTAQILGNNECFEPYTSNIYSRRVIAGDFAVVNTHLIDRLQKLDLWSEDVRKQIIMNNGSVQAIDCIPDDVKRIFKTAWELKMRTLIDMAADRGAFIDQSQSLNLFVAEATHSKLTSMHFYAWKRGLKTGMYYLRTKPAADAIKVTFCTRENKDCLACSA